MNKLYETQSYLKSIITTVEASEEADGKYYIIPADSIFFPEEGGQYSDTGIIKASDKVIKVLHGDYLKSKEGDPVIRYEVDSPLEPGTEIECILDWDNRYDRMQNHSGEHIMTGMIHNRYGLDNVGFHLSDDAPVTLVMNGVLTKEQVMEIEVLANKVIYDNVPITDSYPTKEELENISYRSKIDIQGQVRLITIGEKDNPIDVCACCAPHVKRSGEIGIIKVVSVMNYKGGIQVGILCGRRALEFINHQQNILTSISTALSTAPENVTGIVNSHIEELAALKGELSSLREKEYLQQIGSMSEDDVHIVFGDSELSPINMKNLFNDLTNHFEGYVGVFAGNDSEGYRYFAGSGNLDSKILSNMMRESLGAKGGGSSELIQGKVASTKEEIMSFWKEIQ